MFKKPKRNFRRRAHSSDSDGENDVKPESSSGQVGNGLEIKSEIAIPGLNLAVHSENVQPKEKKKKKKKEDKPLKNKATALSFDHESDEDGEVFKIKRSSHSRRVAKLLKKQNQKEKEGVDVKEEKDTPPSNPYSKESLQEMKKEQDEANGAVEMEMDVNDVNDDEVEEEKYTPDDKNAVKNILESGGIPDANLIHMARKRRQMAREMGDFIPVDDSDKFEQSKSRLIREDDNDRSDDEDNRMEFSVNSHEAERRRMQDTFLAAEHGSDTEGSDHEAEEWEKQQIRKGVQMTASTVQEVPSTSDTSSYYNSMQQYMYTQGSNIFNPGMSEYDTPAPPPTQSLGVRQSGQIPTSLPTITLESIRKRLQDRLDSICEVHRQNVHERDDLASRVELSEEAIVDADSSKGSLEEQYKFFQETRGYVRDLVECLNEKYSTITNLEWRMLSIQRDRTNRLVQRRQEDIKDQSQDIMSGKVGVVPPRDETKQRRIAEREARRARRRRAREAKDIRGHNEGLSTDDEENQSEISKFNMERDRIQEDCDHLFEDVVEDFYDTNIVKSKFESWKRKYRDTYQEAYIGLCLPKLFTPLVRLKLVDWIPFEEECVRIEEMSWYETLMFYCHRIDPEINPDDPDTKLLPEIIDRVMLPKITDLVIHVWDPLSNQQTHRLVKLIRKLVHMYPTISADSKNTQALFQAVVVRIRKTLDDDVFMPLLPRQMLDTRNSPPSLFFHRQCWSCIKLLRNILSWFGLLSDSTVKELALDCLLNRYLLLALQNSPVTQETVQKCQTIVSTFPKGWFTDLPGDETLPHLSLFARCLVATSDKLYESSKDSTKKEIKENIRQLAKMLMTIRAKTQASGIGTKYNIKL